MMNVKLSRRQLERMRTDAEEGAAVHPDPLGQALFKTQVQLHEHIAAVEAELEAIAAIFDEVMPEGCRPVPGESALVSWNSYKFFKARRMVNQLLGREGERHETTV